MDGRCRIEMLGGLRILQNERIITRFHTQKAASLLAYLAYYLQRSHPREVLVELFWPEDDPEDGKYFMEVAREFLGVTVQVLPPRSPTVRLGTGSKVAYWRQP